MSAEKKYTERELVLANREAVIRTVERLGFDRFLNTMAGDWYGSVTLGERLYPLPKVERPRVVSDRYHEWRVRDAVLEWRLGNSTDWKAADFTEASHGSVLYPTPARIALWADLFAHPTELVDDDGAEDGV